ncbi:MAG: hypothetical protein GF404_11755 [candidate division Zixibacteria bacterium]|nr:hypothetical protein [candidate division Zixibacteria bacterium]
MMGNKIKLLTLTAFVMAGLLILNGRLMADEETNDNKIEIFYQDVDTAYKIIKMQTLRNSAVGEEAEIDNENDIRSIVEGLDGDAAIFVDHYETAAGELYTDAIVVEYLNAEEIKKRSEEAKKPPEFKKEHPLDPEPVLIEYGDVDFPYKVLGVINYRAQAHDDLESSQDMDYKLKEVAGGEDANAVLYVQYMRSGSQVSSASGIMVEAMETWEEVEEEKKKEKARRERLLQMIKKKQQEKKQSQNE